MNIKEFNQKIEVADAVKIDGNIYLINSVMRIEDVNENEQPYITATSLYNIYNYDEDIHEFTYEDLINNNATLLRFTVIN